MMTFQQIDERCDMGFSWPTESGDIVPMVPFLEAACARCTGQELKEESQPAVFARCISGHQNYVLVSESWHRHEERSPYRVVD